MIGLLLGSYQVLFPLIFKHCSDNDYIANITHILLVTRKEKTMDRVEIAPEQLQEAFSVAEVIKHYLLHIRK